MQFLNAFIDDTDTITLMHNHKFQYKTNPTIYYPWHSGSGSVPLLPRHLAVAAVTMRLQFAELQRVQVSLMMMAALKGQAKEC